MKIKLFIFHCALISISHGWNLPKSISYKTNLVSDVEPSTIPEVEEVTTVASDDDFTISDYGIDEQATGLPLVDYTQPDYSLLENADDDDETTPLPSFTPDYDISLEEAESGAADISQDIKRLEKLLFLMQNNEDGVLITNEMSETDREHLQQQDISTYEELSMKAESDLENTLDSIEALQDRVGDVILDLNQDIELEAQDSDSRRDLLLKYKSVDSELNDSFNRIRVLEEAKDSLDKESVSSNDPSKALFTPTNGLYPDNKNTTKIGDTDQDDEESNAEDDDYSPDVNLQQIYSRFYNNNSAYSDEDYSDDNIEYDDEVVTEVPKSAPSNESNKNMLDLYTYKNVNTTATENDENNSSTLGKYLNLDQADGLPFNANQSFSGNLNNAIAGNPDVLKSLFGNSKENYEYDSQANQNIDDYENEEYTNEDGEYDLKKDEYDGTNNETYDIYGEGTDDSSEKDLLKEYLNTKDSDQHEGISNSNPPFEFEGQTSNEDYESKFKDIYSDYFESSPEPDVKPAGNVINVLTEISDDSAVEEPEDYQFSLENYNYLFNQIEDSDEDSILTNLQSSAPSTETSLDMDENQGNTDLVDNDLIDGSNEGGIFNGQSAKVQPSFENFIAKINSSLNEKERKQIETEEEKIVDELIKDENEQDTKVDVSLPDNESPDSISNPSGLSVMQLALIISAAAIPMLLVIALLVVISMRRWNKKKVPYNVMEEDDVFDKKILPSETGSDQYSVNV